MMALQLDSTAFPFNGPIPRRHGGDGEDLSPPLAWSGAPRETIELALIVDDPDAPTSKPWVHWLLYTIPSSVQSIREGVPPKPSPSFPAGCHQGKNSWATIGYRGPAPPKGHGVHHYHFKLYALDSLLGLSPGLQKDELVALMRGHILAEANYIGTYER